MVITWILLASLMHIYYASQPQGEVMSTVRAANNKYQSSDDMQTIHSTRLEKVEEERLTEISVNHHYDGLSNNRKRDEDGVTERITLNAAAGQSTPSDSPDHPNELFYQESTHSGSPIKHQLQGKLSVCFFLATSVFSFLMRNVNFISGSFYSSVYRFPLPSFTFKQLNEFKIVKKSTNA